MIFVLLLLTTHKQVQCLKFFAWNSKLFIVKFQSWLLVLYPNTLSRMSLFSSLQNSLLSWAKLLTVVWTLCLVISGGLHDCFSVHFAFFYIELTQDLMVYQSHRQSAEESNLRSSFPYPYTQSDFQKMPSNC